MSAHEYVPGLVPVLVTADAMVAVDSGIDTLVDLARASAGGPLTVERVVESLTREGMSRLATFAAVVRRDQRLTVLVRGPISVRVGPDRWDGLGVVTWAERVVDDLPFRVTLTDHETAGPALPISAGIVLAAACGTEPGPQSGTQSEQVRHRGESEALHEDVGAPPVGLVEPPDDEPHDVESGNSSGIDGPEGSHDDGPGSAEDPAATRFDDVGAARYEPMFGATQIGRRHEDAAVRDQAVHPASAGSAARPSPPEDADADPPAAIAPEGDHDGLTMTPAQAAAMREARRGSTADEVPSPPTVRARVEMSSGRVLELDRPVVIGREPSAQADGSSSVPHLVIVDDPGVSRRHLVLALEATGVRATDVSSNGTVLTPRGGVARAMPAGQPVSVGDGDVLRINDTVTARVVVEDVAP